MPNWHHDNEMITHYVHVSLHDVQKRISLTNQESAMLMKPLHTKHTPFSCNTLKWRPQNFNIHKNKNC